MFLLAMAKLESQHESQRSYTPMPKDNTWRMFWWIFWIVVLNFNTVSWLMYKILAVNTDL